MSLGTGPQLEQTAHLQGFGLNDSSPHEVLRVGVHVVQESRAKPQDLGLNDFCIRGVAGFEDFLCLLLGETRLLPMLEKVLGCHLSWLEELVDGPLG